MTDSEQLATIRKMIQIAIIDARLLASNPGDQVDDVLHSLFSAYGEVSKAMALIEVLGLLTGDNGDQQDNFKEAYRLKEAIHQGIRTAARPRGAAAQLADPSGEQRP